MNETLIIEAVDFGLLERQRRLTNNLFDRLKADEYFETMKEEEALEGILVMLDHWSDLREATE